MNTGLTNLSFEENQTRYASETFYIDLPPLIFEKVNTSMEIKDSAVNDVTEASNTTLDSMWQNPAVKTSPVFTMEEETSNTTLKSMWQNLTVKTTTPASKIEDIQRFTTEITTSVYDQMEERFLFTAEITTPTYEEKENIFRNSTFTSTITTMIPVTEQGNITNEIVNNFTAPKIENDAKKKESDYMFYCIAIVPLVFVFLFYLCFLMCYIRRHYRRRINSQSAQGTLPISA